MIKKDDKERNKRPASRGRRKEKSEFDQKVIDIARVTRVVKGGKRFSFRTTIVIGDRKGRVGVGIAKGPDMKVSTEKSFAQAKKAMIKIGFTGNTIPYQVEQKIGSAKILLKPADKGRGIVAGGAVRAVVSLVGISDISAKMLGSKNKLNNARATIKALEKFSSKTVGEVKKAEEQGKTKEAEKAVNEKTAKKEEKKTAVVSEKKVVKEKAEKSAVKKAPKKDE
ncbi:MAG: 30S ribosomal protein S5 [Candidatus Pacebacteria bacterium]|nr:30S ribosomal protein S5 [Candidatus Paceibacterota bacterium]